MLLPWRREGHHMSTLHWMYLLFHLEVLLGLQERALLLDIRMSSDLVGAVASMGCLAMVDKWSLHR